MIVPLFFRKLVLGMMAMDGVNATNAGAQVIQVQTSGKNYAAILPQVAQILPYIAISRNRNDQSGTGQSNNKSTVFRS
jgi:uncharacterized spore protein YtfJ